MGHILSYEGWKVDEKKVLAIKDMDPPKDITQLKRFMGMMNHIQKFLPKISDQTETLR